MTIGSHFYLLKDVQYVGLDLGLLRQKRIFLRNLSDAGRLCLYAVLRTGRALR